MPESGRRAVLAMRPTTERAARAVRKLLRSSWLPALTLFGIPALTYTLTPSEPARWAAIGTGGVLALAAYRWVRAGVS